MVWLAKIATWCFGLAIIWAPWIIIGLWIIWLVLFNFEPTDWQQMMNAPMESSILTIACIPLTFAVAQLCGMAIPRGITAGVIALVVTIALGLAEVALVRGMMIPFWGLLVLPVALLAVTWAWSGDWLLDRPAPGRYLRLGALLAGAFAVLLGGYIGYRAWGIPDPGPIAPPSAWAATASLSSDRNAAELYREAARRLRAIPKGVPLPGNPDVRRGPRPDPTRVSDARLPVPANLAAHPAEWVGTGADRWALRSGDGPRA